MQSSRSNKRKDIEDLDLRLGPLARNYDGRYPDLITLLNDVDDDLAMPLFPISSSWVPIITEEDLELRLGFRAQNGAAGNSGESRGEPSECVEAKYGVASSSRREVMERVKLRCTICMDTMKEETSTLCGHVFCKSCIINAIQFQNRCPTCRKEVYMNNIHRIYLPGATS